MSLVEIYIYIKEFFLFYFIAIYSLQMISSFFAKFPSRVEDIISRWNEKFKFFNDFHIEYPMWREWRNYRTFEIR